VLESLEGHLRAILATLTVEEVYRNMNKFAMMVKEVASPDLGKMGMELMSFTIKDVQDSVDYLESLGRAQTAFVHTEASVGVATAERDSGIRWRQPRQKQTMPTSCVPRSCSRISRWQRWR